MNSASTDSMWNADGSMFYLCTIAWRGCSTRSTAPPARWPARQPLRAHRDGRGGHGIPPTPRCSTGSALTPATGNSTRSRCRRVPRRLLHNFDAEIPTGGYPSSRVQMSPDARYFAVTASTFAGQDSYDYVVVWDRQTNTSKTLNVAAKFGAGVYLHSVEMDNSGQYIRLGGTTQPSGRCSGIGRLTCSPRR